jgi:predicted phosphoribosyltransferase
MQFRNRQDAGHQLAEVVAAARLKDPVVVGLARGGVLVAREVAARLGAPLDVMVVRKLGAPGNPEFAVGAVARDHVHVDEPVIAMLGIPRSYVESVIAREMRELDRRERIYRRGTPPISVAGRTVILVDDGLATGSCARPAIASLRAREAARIILAVPIAAPDTAAALRRVADDVIAIRMPRDFQAVGFWYRDFTPTSDADVMGCLDAQGADDCRVGRGKPVRAG